MVYASLITEQLQRPCSNCKQLGHWARECHEEDHRKEQQKKDNGNDKGEQTDTEPNMDCPSKKKGVTPPAHAKQDKPKLNPFLVYIDSFAIMSFVANEHLL
jgi:hypothetical protein